MLLKMAYIVYSLLGSKNSYYLEAIKKHLYLYKKEKSMNLPKVFWYLI